MNLHARRRDDSLQLVRLQTIACLFVFFSLMMHDNLATALPAVGEGYYHYNGENTFVYGKNVGKIDLRSLDSKPTSTSPTDCEDLLTEASCLDIQQNNLCPVFGLTACKQTCGLCSTPTDRKSKELRDPKCRPVDLLVELPISKNNFSKVSTTHAFVRRCKGATTETKACVTNDTESNLEHWHVTIDTDMVKKKEISMSWVSHDTCKYQRRSKTNCSLQSVRECHSQSTTHYFDEVTCNCTCIVQIKGESTCRATAQDPVGEDFGEIMKNCKTIWDNLEKKIFHHKNHKDASYILSELKKYNICIDNHIKDSELRDRILVMLLNKTKENLDICQDEKENEKLDICQGEKEKENLDICLDEKEKAEEEALIQYGTISSLNKDNDDLLNKLKKLGSELEEERKQYNKLILETSENLKSADSQLKESQRETEEARAAREDMRAQYNELELKFIAIESHIKNQEDIGSGDWGDRYNDIYFTFRNDHM